MSGLCEKCADKACPDYYHGIVECQDFQPMTNADHIRAMTDEELANYIWQLQNTKERRSTNDWLDWLKQEAEDE